VLLGVMCQTTFWSQLAYMLTLPFKSLVYVRCVNAFERSLLFLPRLHLFD